MAQVIDTLRKAARAAIHAGLDDAMHDLTSDYPLNLDNVLVPSDCLHDPEYTNLITEPVTPRRKNRFTRHTYSWPGNVTEPLKSPQPWLT